MNTYNLELSTRIRCYLMLWKSPIYKFRIPVNEESDYLNEIIIDVTGSALGDTTVHDAMTGIWERILDDQGDEIDNILDFGAGNLRNTLYFLDKRKNVTAVEFQDLSKKSKPAKEMLAKCEGKKNFHNLVFPYPFIGQKQKYDLIILVNVVPVMPVFAERMALLDLLYNSVNDDKYILWYTMPEGAYKKIKEEGKNDCADGLWMGKTNHYKTFYKYHSRDDIIEMFSLYGFKSVKKYPASGNDVLLFQKTKHNLFRGILSPEKIIKVIPRDDTFGDDPPVKFKKVKRTGKIKEIIPNSYCFSIEKLYADSLKSIPAGKEGTNPEKYHRLISQIISRIFRGSLRNMTIKPDMFQKLYIVDTVYSNTGGGIFSQLLENSGFKFSYILLEAKNLSFDPENNEFNQISSRLGKDTGDFGLLVCRTIGDKALAKKHSETILTLQSKLVVILTDEDILELLDMRANSDEDGIYDFMDTKIRSIRFRSSK